MNYANLPLPEVRELPFDLGWAEWDKAVLEQDTGFMSLEPIERDAVMAKLSERSVLRAEAKS